MNEQASVLSSEQPQNGPSPCRAQESSRGDWISTGERASESTVAVITTQRKECVRASPSHIPQQAVV